MDLSRRNFFGVAAASPMAAKEAATSVIEAAQMEASGMSVYGDSLYTGINTYGFEYDNDDEQPMRTLWDAIKDIGMPEWKKDDLWADAKRSRTIDPDVASMRSLSMNAKLQMQWKLPPRIRKELLEPEWAWVWVLRWQTKWAKL